MIPDIVQGHARANYGNLFPILWYEQDNLYLFDYRSEISDAIGNAIGLDFTRKRLR